MLLAVSGARERAELAVTELAEDGAEDHLVEALEEAARDLRALSARLGSTVGG